MPATMQQHNTKIKREYMRLALLYTTLVAACALLQFTNGLEWASLHVERVYMGEYWRIFTAHLIHIDWPHFAMNMIGMGLCLLVYKTDLAIKHWLGSVFFISVVSSSGLLLIYDIDQRYVGFSDVLHGWIILGALAIFPREPKLALTVFVLFWLKIIEENSGLSFFTNAGMDIDSIATESHLFGAIGGVAYGVLFLQDFRQSLLARLGLINNR